MDFFPGFKRFHIATSGAEINGVVGGSGPPLLLLQGWPQTHLEWRHVAPVLAQHFTVVATDLRGYGDSSKPPSGENHAGYSKRAMAQDQVEVMRQLGFELFNLVGHDRGGRVACRLALDHPRSVARLALLDIVPTRTVYTQVSKNLATWYFHWFFLIQPEPLPEMLLGGHAEPFLRNFAFRGLIPHAIEEPVFAEYLRCFANPQTLHAMCEDYRAGATMDFALDVADRGARRIECPVLVLWGGRGKLPELYDDVLSIWRVWASDVRGRALDCGHYLAEEAPAETLGELLTFFEQEP
jgi:haloacetate dehalogenase